MMASMQIFHRWLGLVSQQITSNLDCINLFHQSHPDNLSNTWAEIIGNSCHVVAASF